MHKYTLLMRRIRARYKEQGLCYCGRKREDEDYRQCRTCREGNKRCYTATKAAQRKQFRKENQELMRKLQRRSHLKSTYGITPEQFDAMLQFQGGVCAICKGPPTAKGVYFIDHNHVTGQVREILCGKCNSGIGYADESIERLDAMKRYLIKHGRNEMAA